MVLSVISITLVVALAVALAVVALRLNDIEKRVKKTEKDISWQSTQSILIPLLTALKSFNNPFPDVSEILRNTQVKKEEEK